MKKISLFILLFSSFIFSQNNEKAQITETLNSWHAAAGSADFDAYFDLMTNDAVFIGTDATENWQRDAFMGFSKPYFDKGKAWNFTAVERNIYINNEADFAWFDELLDTQMKICRGSGVLKKINGQWKVAHYVLSIAVPNDLVDELVELKKETDNTLLEKLKTN
ncbi:nuclear transport factor 2 family protein [Maribacter dokdonensis]|uniref:nuclear transport factor 2 family protein n=1 Tax=Maribacter dokdonensis TaxID=320912 RepID=UPI001C08BF1C|nr:nuclear transport factor 2 family protein [Maribacter dokdonensis]MBU2900292.1 nuclear transport factor 2 family protein [Maribacter dokdonensis]